MAVQKTITHCTICEMICGLVVTSEDDRVVSVLPDKKNPYTWRDYCIKGAHSGDVRDHTHRIRQPMRRVGDHYEPATYDEAIADISTRLKAIRDVHGVNAIASYSGNPAGSTFSIQNYMNALIDAIGSTTRFSVGSVDQNAVLVAAKAMFGSEGTMLLPDLDDCDYYLLFGSNPAISRMCWMGKTPNGWKRMLARMPQAKLTIVDPRRTESADKASRHVAILPEQDWAFMLGMLKVIFSEGLDRLGRHDLVANVDVLKDLALSVDLGDMSARCRVSVNEIEEVAREFATARTAVAIARTGPAQGRNGTLAEWLSLVLNLVTDRIDTPGGRFLPNWPISLSRLGRPSAKLPVVKSRVRGLPQVGGGFSLAELPDEITTPGKGQVRALFIASGNPVSAGPDGAAIDAALAELDLLVSIDMFQRESHRHAHWLIPGTHMLEREEIHVKMHSMNDRPFIQTSRRAVPVPEGIIPEWEFLLRLADAMDVKLFGGHVATPDELAESFLKSTGVVTVEQIRAAEHGLEFGERTLGHLWREFEEIGEKLDACPAAFAEMLRQRLAEPLVRGDAQAYPFQLISRRRKGMMNAWLSDTVAMLSEADSTNVVEIHSTDAANCGLTDGQPVTIRSENGALDLVLRVTDRCRRGVALFEHGWGGRVSDPASGTVTWSEGKMRNLLIGADELDPLTGVPRLNGMPVAIEAR